jgi:hypothetical protein
MTKQMDFVSQVESEDAPRDQYDAAGWNHLAHPDRGLDTVHDRHDDVGKRDVRWPHRSQVNGIQSAIYEPS